MSRKPNPRLDPSIPLRKSKSDFANCVSISGIKEALEEPIIWIRRIYQLVLLFLLACTLYYIRQMFLQWSERRYADQVQIVSDRSWLPASNVTVCAQIYINETFVKNEVQVPEKLAELVQKESGYDREEFLHWFASYLSHSTRVGSYNESLVKRFRTLYEANPGMHDFSAFMEQASPSCSDMLTNCKFEGRPFDCCQRTMAYQAGYGDVCFQTAVS